MIMKTAILFCGKPRFNHFFIDFLTKIQSKKKIDLYFYLWDEDDSNIPKHIFSQIPDRYCIKSFKFRKELDFDLLIPRESESISMRTMVNKIFKQAWPLYKGYMEVNESYDTIIKARTDCTINSFIDLDNSEFETGKIYTGRTFYDLRHYNVLDYYEKVNAEVPFTDQIFMGRETEMGNFFSLYEKIDEILMNTEVRKTYEKCLENHFSTIDIGIAKTNFDIFIGRQNYKSPPKDKITSEIEDVLQAMNESFYSNDEKKYVTISDFYSLMNRKDQVENQVVEEPVEVVEKPKRKRKV